MVDIKIEELPLSTVIAAGTFVLLALRILQGYLKVLFGS